MKLTHALLFGLVVVGAVLLAELALTGRWEQRAREALAQRDSITRVVDSLSLQRDSLLKVKARIHRVVVTRRDSIRIVDSLTPAPSGCQPNLAIRDSVIAAQGRELHADSLIISTQAEQLAAVRLSNDSLAAALRARPAWHPWSLYTGRSINVGFYYDPLSQRGGVAVQLSLGGLRLP